jgi:hypothetical protein
MMNLLGLPTRAGGDPDEIMVQAARPLSNAEKTQFLDQ